MAKQGLTAVLDVGSSKVVCFIAYIDAGGRIKVTGIGHQLSEGIRGGIVIDVKKAEGSILAAVNAAEKMAGEVIDNAVINVSGGTLQSRIIQVRASISGQEVTDRDINHVIAQGYEQVNRQEAEIVHCIPLGYTIDDARGIRDPRGMYGEALSTELHVITASGTTVRNMANCLARCHLNVQDYVCSPYVSGLACLTEDEKNLGAVVLDIGGGHTSIAIFAGGNCIYVDSLALGGMHVTRDIAKGLSTGINYAERIKTLYGSVVSTDSDERETIDIDIAAIGEEDTEEALITEEHSYISKALLTSIIKPRMEEILEMAKKKVDASGLSEVAGPRVVITGGGSQIQGLKELAGFVFRKNVRLGRPKPLQGLAEATKGPSFATAIGSLIYLSEKQRIQAGSVKETEAIARKGALHSMVKWFQKNF